MSISGISSSTSSYLTTQASPFTRIKQDFESLGKALESGSLEDAKKAFAQLQKDTPTQSDSGTNPMSEDMDSLGKALESGDLEAAQEVYSKIQEKISQGPGEAGAAKNAPASQAGSGSTGKAYDKKDINKDGTVSYEEEMAYSLSHPEEADSSQQNQQGTGSLNAMVGGNIDIMA